MARRRCYSPYRPASRNAPNPGPQASRSDDFAINKSGVNIRPVTVRQIPLAVPVQEDWITYAFTCGRIDRLVAASNVPAKAHAFLLTKRSASPSFAMLVRPPRTSTPKKDFNRIFHVLYLLLWKMETRRGEYSPESIFESFLNILTAYPQDSSTASCTSQGGFIFAPAKIFGLSSSPADAWRGSRAWWGKSLREFSLFPRLCRFSTVPARIDFAMGPGALI